MIETMLPELYDAGRVPPCMLTADNSASMNNILSEVEEPERKGVAYLRNIYTNQAGLDPRSCITSSITDLDAHQSRRQ